MEIVITQEALSWFKNEMDIKSGDMVRFFVRYGGHGGIHQGFSLGMTKDQAKEAAIQFEIEGIVFFIEEADRWYFDKEQLVVDYDEKSDDITFTYS